MFKIYVADTGLFMAMLDKGTSGDVINGLLNIYKGALYENAIANIIYSSGKKLYYFSKNSGLEIDFITTIANKLTLIEVKAKNGNAKSSKTILNDKIKYPEVKQLVRFSENNISVIDNKKMLPHYLAFLVMKN